MTAPEDPPPVRPVVTVTLSMSPVSVSVTVCHVAELPLVCRYLPLLPVCDGSTCVLVTLCGLLVLDRCDWMSASAGS